MEEFPVSPATAGKQGNTAPPVIGLTCQNRSACPGYGILAKRLACRPLLPLGGWWCRLAEG